MSREDKLNVVFGKSFAQYRLSLEECELVKDMLIQDFLKEDFTHAQANLIISWVKHECQRHEMQSTYIKKDEE